WRTAEVSADVTHTPLSRMQDRDLFTLGKRQEARRQGSEADRAHATSFATPASSLESPRAIASQNHCRCSRLATGGRPGDRIASLPVRAVVHPGGRPISTPPHRGVATTG